MKRYCLALDLIQQILQRAVRQELHHQVGVLLLRAAVEDLHDPRVAHTACAAGLVEEALDGGLGGAGAQHLDGAALVQVLVVAS